MLLLSKQRRRGPPAAAFRPAARDHRLLRGTSLKPRHLLLIILFISPQYQMGPTAIQLEGWRERDAWVFGLVSAAGSTRLGNSVSKVVCISRDGSLTLLVLCPWEADDSTPWSRAFHVFFSSSSCCGRVFCALCVDLSDHVVRIFLFLMVLLRWAFVYSI